MLSGLSGLSGLSAVCGGAVAAVPTAPAGATFAVAAHPSCCRSDAACSVPCGDGDAIRWWRDLVTGVWYEQATSGFRPLLRYDATSGWHSEGDGVSRYFRFLLSSAIPGPKSVGLRDRHPSLGGVQASSSLDSGNTLYGRWNGANGGLYSNTGGGWVFQDAYYLLTNHWYTTVAVQSGGATDGYIDGSVVPRSITGGADYRLAWSLQDIYLHSWDTAYSSPNHVHRMCAFDSAVGHAAVEEWLEEPNL